MAKYRKKPVVIEATQWFPPDTEIHYPPPYQPDKLSVYWTGQTWQMNTLEGLYNVAPGDWIITGIVGERYLRKPDVFNKTYERVIIKEFEAWPNPPEWVTIC